MSKNKQPRDGDGRFMRVDFNVTEIKKTPENPDKKLATRGYVKCLMRETRDHSHAIVNRNEGLVWICGALIGLVSAMSFNATSFSSIVPYSILFMLVCFVGFGETIMTSTRTDNIREYGHPKLLKKWDPPKCEDHDDEC